MVSENVSNVRKFTDGRQTMEAYRWQCSWYSLGPINYDKMQRMSKLDANH